ncbi:MAG: hypothetical protein A2Y03_06685 [Omnitrophica WOR_2 bacterium GWF2_38_59]|nr:MAG: hypothetical protein A2Y06_07670 [Omnitrophica WOR_2 bacterium GWA2_37_7]OGX23094.1 MAG: hypothetical protein A2Y03_06685 [Omnitrophica WOR_2 bacterium GWF2_38_59]OGX49425.1 MAG: hypothetical protein A2243_09435 [Omnitrophica WOR_2 bacterium RIFOXYA2_FULL_38_17]OGX52138.1 MAG: hypothetical protein A2267_05540 [Omnitrophica WOR_2 bacterium RIFOXYA12_FULL_38_10]OGX55930.1 MAG: hypothetical protein A2306_12360 [Omnitrophica WOR_2 bacterium RIFOXYB2_FULL_38_16]OGX57020.1 MAG: hypothetical 
MKDIMQRLLFIILLVVVSGCANVTETAKVVLGNSTKALEEGRAEAIKKSYACSYQECFYAVLSLAKNEEPEPLSEKKYFEVFSKKIDKDHIVVMGIPGNVDTTEVGIFFARRSLKSVEIEISSRSSSAKRKVAKAVFKELDLRFPEIE